MGTIMEIKVYLRCATWFAILFTVGWIILICLYSQEFLPHFVSKYNNPHESDNGKLAPGTAGWLSIQSYPPSFVDNDNASDMVTSRNAVTKLTNYRSTVQLMTTESHLHHGKDEAWISGLDVPHGHEKLYKKVNQLADNKTSTKLLWFVPEMRDFYHKLQLAEYIEEYATSGNPLEPLTQYSNPCWKEKRHPGTTNKEPSLVRCLPGIILAGFTKSGTTDLHNSLVMHPQINPAERKEIGFLAPRVGLPRNYSLKAANESKPVLLLYLKHFTNASIEIERQAKLGHQTFTLDATPSTAWRPARGYDLRTPGLNIRGLIPSAKIIFIMRNPADRAISHYKHFGGSTAEQMYYKVKATVEMLKSCISRKGIYYCAYRGHEHGDQHSLSLRTGMYFVYLTEWMEIFPRDQLLIIKAEDYYRNRVATMEKVFQFLRLESLEDLLRIHLQNETVANRDEHLWTSERITDDHKLFLKKSRGALQEFYKPFNQRLANLLGESDYLTWNDRP